MWKKDKENEITDPRNVTTSSLGRGRGREAKGSVVSQSLSTGQKKRQTRPFQKYYTRRVTYKGPGQDAFGVPEKTASQSNAIR